MDALQRSRPKAFIFKQDYKRLLNSKIRQEEQGNLFGLWTTDGEPVIHIISGPKCCPHSKQSGSNLADIPNAGFPLMHIGNWRYAGVDSSEYVQKYRHQIDDSWCFHKGRPNFLDMIVTESRVALNYQGSEKEIVTLPNESPFRSMEGIKQIAIKGLNEDSILELSGMEQLSITGSRPSNTGQFQLPLKVNKLVGAQRSIQTAYIFKKERERFVKSKHDGGGSIFGLWTTDGEPVIHIMGKTNCCIESGLHDIASKTLPLTHIGNWRYSGSSQAGLQSVSGTCRHQAEANFLDVIVTPDLMLLLLQNDKGKKIETLPGESPFRNLEGINKVSIYGQSEDGDSDGSEDMKQPSVITDVQSKSMQFKVTSNLRGTEDDTTKVDEFTRTFELQEGPMYLGTQRLQREFAVNRYGFKVFVFQEDYQMMTNLVLRYPNLETGGDLFGLWTTDGNAILHVVLGPGQNCKRTGASFFQDISYLKRNGELLTEDYMLCHIGEWHSHHRLGLFQPSGGDSSTVIRNYPHGVCGFLLIIANIVSSHEVKLSPYLYTATSSYGFDQKGEIVVLRSQNAFKRTRNIKDSIERGKEIESFSQGAFYRFSENQPTFHESSTSRYQRPHEAVKYTRYRYPTSRQTQYLSQNRHLRTQPPHTYRFQPRNAITYAPIADKTRLTNLTSRPMGRVNKWKTTKLQTKLDNRPRWKP